MKYSSLNSYLLVLCRADFWARQRHGSNFVSSPCWCCHFNPLNYPGRRACDVRQSWLGKGPSRTKSLHNNYHNVHRIKVDEERGFFITTHGSQAIVPFGVFNPNSGGLVVADITDGTPIWIMYSVSIQFNPSTVF